MPRQKKVVQMFVVKNGLGQRLGTYQAYTAKQAIARFLDDQAVYASQFKGSGYRDLGLTAEPK